MLTRFILYGIFGCFGEVLWTSMSEPVMSLARRARIDVKLPARTYLWMFPIYGVGGLLFEELAANIGTLAWPLRGLVYMAFCFIGEYAWGFLIKRLTGEIPWDYSDTRYHVHGLIRLDYAPLWFVAGLITEWTVRVVGAAAPAIDRLG